LGFIAKNLDGYLPAIRGHTDADNALFATVDRAITADIPEAFESLALQQAVEAWLQAVFACNAYIDSEAPWTLRKTDPERMETVLATLYICIAQLAVAISPVIPASSAKLLDTLGIAGDLRNLAGIRSHWYSPLAESDHRIIAPAPLFPRLELPAEAA
jgi:methionyl-tRNA synthetase